MKILGMIGFNSNCGKVTIWSPQHFGWNHMVTPNLNINIRHKGQLLLSFGCIFVI